ncbi:MAG: virulence factor [Chloroflexota bacterium]|nr:virulence factor [Chloroflexota bacterium]
MAIGYSFGADVLPQTWGALPADVQAKIVQISLPGLSDVADWEITVSGWLGSTSSDAQPVGPALAQMPAERLQCVLGAEETDSACPSLAGTGAELIETKGGHHFDGDYAALAAKILGGLERRATGQIGSAPSSDPISQPQFSPANRQPALQQRADRENAETRTRM